MKHWNAFDWAWRTVLIVISVLVFMSVLSGPAIAQDKDCLKAETYPQLFVDNSLKMGYSVEVLGTWEYEHARGIFVQLTDKSDPPRWYFYEVDYTGKCVNKSIMVKMFNEDGGAKYILDFVEKQQKDKGV